MIFLPHIFSHGMVLAKKARIWGFCDSDTPFTLTFLGQSYSITPTADTRGGYGFEQVLESPSYGGPHTLTIGEHTLKDVYIGRVFLCAGQSNMEQPLSRALGLEAHIQPDSRIHAFQAEKNHHFGEAKTDVAGQWETYTGDFSHLFGLPYFFARQVLASLQEDIPIGLLNVAAGGTPVESWLSEAVVGQHLKAAHERLQPYKNPDFVEEVVRAGDERHRAWFSDISFETTDTDWQTTDLLMPVMDTPGAVVYRKALPYLAGPLHLNLGRVIDSVRVFINGTDIGHIGYQYPPAVFTVPDGLLTPHDTNWLTLQVLGETQPPYVVAGKTYALTNPEGVSIDLSCDWQYQITQVKTPHEPGFWFYNLATGCYNYMLAPLIRYSIDAFLWYQGESNTAEPEGYADKFALLVDSIREHNPDVPVYYTQLANLINPNAPWPVDKHPNYNFGTGWAILREQQRQCLSLPNTHMAVTIDCGEDNDLHPADKKTVGERLARLYLNPTNTGPVVKAHSLVDGLLTITFDQGAGLWSKNGRPELVINGHHIVTAKIIHNTLMAQLPQVKPQVVRFGWSDCPSVTLYNAQGLPASPFELVL